MGNKAMQPTGKKIDEFLAQTPPGRAAEARVLIGLLRKITALEPVMWGPSIIGFGSRHYQYETEREGEMPLAAFSPRKARIVLYFPEGFAPYAELLERLGKHRTTVSCLYVNKLEDIDLRVLEEIMELSFRRWADPPKQADSVEAYIQSVPDSAKEKFTELRELIHSLLPEAKEVVSYGILGYKTDSKKAKVYISAFQGHLGLYPLPRDGKLKEELAPYIRGKGTLRFSLREPLPKELIARVVGALVTER